LGSIPTAGSPANLVHDFLRGFFKHDRSLEFQEISFNLPDEDEVDLHINRMKDLVEVLQM
jgi:hypothetical protein